MPVHFCSNAKHGARAVAYLTGTLTEEQLDWMIYELQQLRGSHTLVSLSADDVIDAVEGGGHPELEAIPPEKLEVYAKAAAARVANKWESPGHEYYGALEWAVEMVGEWWGEDQGKKGAD